MLEFNEQGYRSMFPNPKNPTQLITLEQMDLGDIDAMIFHACAEAKHWKKHATKRRKIKAREDAKRKAAKALVSPSPAPFVPSGPASVASTPTTEPAEPYAVVPWAKPLSAYQKAMKRVWG